MSRPARGGWIEMAYTIEQVAGNVVPPRTGRVD